MRNGLRQSMSWLHAWAGLVAGWLLFAIFVTGTASYYRDDISRWMRPEQRALVEVRDPAVLARAAEVAIADLRQRAPGALAWFVRMPTEKDPMLDLYWRMTPDEVEQARIDPETGKSPAVRATDGGDFFYRFHFELLMPSAIGRWIVGICAMTALVAILSGIITHRRIFRDFFTFRRSKSAQRGWLDAHNVVGVLALPFHAMIIYTGIATLALTYMPWGVMVAYKGDAAAFFSEARQATAPRLPAGKAIVLAPIGPMVEKAVAAIPEPLEGLFITAPDDANAKVVAFFEEPHGLAHLHPQVAFDGATGEVTETLYETPKPAVQTFATMVGLHEAHFAGPALRALFFLCGLMGAAMIATGLVLWTIARVPNPGMRPHFGMRLVQILNVGSVAGLMVGVATYFLANRLLPVEWLARGEWERGFFFGAWIAAAAFAVVRPHRQAWRDVLGAAAALFAIVPIVDAITTGHGLFAEPATGDPLYLWFGAAMIGLSILLGFAAIKAGQVTAKVPLRATTQIRSEGAAPRPASV